MSSEERLERATEQARHDAPRIALQAYVHPRELPEEPGQPLAPPMYDYARRAAVPLGEKQAAMFARRDDAWRVYHGTLAGELARLNVAYFLVTPRASEGLPVDEVFEPTAYAVDLSRWEPRARLAELAEPPPPTGVRTYTDEAFGASYPLGAGLLDDFKPKVPRWLRALDRFVLKRENRRRRHMLAARMRWQDEDGPD